MKLNALPKKEGFFRRSSYAISKSKMISRRQGVVGNDFKPFPTDTFSKPTTPQACRRKSDTLCGLRVPRWRGIKGVDVLM